MEKSKLFPAFLVLIVPEVGNDLLGFSVGEKKGGGALVCLRLMVSVSKHQGQLQHALNVALPLYS